MRFFKFLFLFLLTLILSETILWIVRPSAIEFYRIQKSYHILEPDYFIDLKPDVNVHVKHFQNFFEMDFSTNEYGFRGTNKVDNSKPQIICIGDSVTMGFGVSDEDTFCRKLDHFKDKSGTEYQALNLGVDAYGPSAIHLKLKKYLPKLNGKLLYYFPSPGDDVDEAWFSDKKTNPLSKLIFDIQFELARKSYLFIAIKITQEQMKYRFVETFLWPVEKIFRTDKCLKNELEPLECTDTYFPHRPFHFFAEFLKAPKRDKNAPPEFPEKECSESEADYKISQPMLDEIEKIIGLAGEYKMKLVIALVPVDIETAYCAQKGKKHRFYAYPLALKKYLKSRNIDTVDLSQYADRMKDESGKLNTRPYYIYGDGHYTKTGNNWVYEVLKEKTEEVLNAL